MKKIVLFTFLCGIWGTAVGGHWGYYSGSQYNAYRYNYGYAPTPTFGLRFDDKETAINYLANWVGPCQSGNTASCKRTKYKLYDVSHSGGTNVYYNVSFQAGQTYNGIDWWYCCGGVQTYRLYWIDDSYEVDYDIKDDQMDGPPSCPVGNPINVTTGSKFQKITVYKNINNFELDLYYQAITRRGNSAGIKWTHSFEFQLTDVDPVQIYAGTYSAGTKKLTTPDQTVYYFSYQGGNYTALYNKPGVQLEERFESGILAGQTYTDLSGNTYLFDLNGNLTQIVYLETPNVVTMQYTNDKLSKISDAYGTWLNVDYNLDGRIEKFTDQNSNKYVLSYVTNSPAIKSVSRLDQNDVAIDDIEFKYLIETANNELVSIPNALALVQILDERDMEYANWSYNDKGLATYSGHGVKDLNGSRSEEYLLTYNGDGTTIVTNPFGKDSIYHLETVNRVQKVTEVSGQASTNCVAANAFYSYDANGLGDKVTDWEGHVTDYDYGPSGLIEMITEGLVWTDPVTRTTTTTTTDTRITELDWIESTRQIEEARAPGITTHYDYWPNNRLKQVTQTDTTSQTNPFGSTAGQQRTTTYTYTYHNGTGLPVDVLVDTLTIDGPLPGTTDQTVYQYDQQGRLLSITNALGQAQTFSNFDGRGQAQTITDANGVVTELGYHPRGWLETLTVKDPSGNAALDTITQYTWYANGTLEQLTFPDGSFLHYEYNDARHLIEIRNNLDEVVEFVPDAMGNWTTSRTKDPSSNIKRLQQRAFDELGRLMDLFGNNSQHTHYDYDTNGNVKQVIENSGTSSITTTMNYDTLDRLQEVLKPINTEQNGQSVLVNVDTEYDYDGADNLTMVTDPKGNTTTYVYNGFGDKITQISPDTGTTHYWYNEQGNLTFKQDARNVTVQYHYDDLGRLTWIQYPNSVEDVHYYYDEVDANNPYALGKLTRITDQTGSIAYQYDHRGNLTQDARILAGQTYSTGYGYNLADKLTQLTYPSGRIVHYYRNDALGRISAVTTQRTALDPEQSVVSGIQYLPFGPIQQYTYGNGLVRQVPYDLDYRIDQIQVSDTQSVLDLDYGYDAFNNITSILDNLNSSDSQTFTYDDLHRLQHAYGNYGTNIDHVRYEYDPVGNRTLKALSQGATMHTTETYAYDPLSNQLNTVTLDTGASQAVRSLIYNDTGAVDSETTFSGQSRTYGYNDNLRLIELSENSNTLGSYQLNALGQRISKTTDTATEVFHYSSQGLQLASSDSQGNLLQEHLYLGSEPIAVVVADPVTSTSYVDLSSTSPYTSQDSSSGSVQSSSNSITLVGNRWRFVDGATFTLAADSVVEFDFMADGLGEIQGIGFDNDSNANNGGYLFQLSGTQSFGDETYSYTSGGTVQHFTIPVGQYITGDMQLVIINDKDANPDTSTLTISNVTLCESNCGGAAQ